MRIVRRSWILITLLAAGACGSSTPPPPSSGPGTETGQSITGRERIGWDQRADSLSELATFHYAIYVDGARSVVGDSSCSSTAGTNGYACSGRLPAMSNGSHTLELAAFVDGGDGGVIEGSRSPSISVTVSATTAPPTGWSGARIETTLDGVTLGIDKITAGLNRPNDAAFLPDGRLLIAERTGNIRVIVDGKLQDRDALALASLDDALPPPTLSIAIDPDFARTGFVFVAHDVPSRDATVFRVSRYRELHGRLAERAVLFEAQTAAPAGVAVIRFGPDGKLYLAVSGESSNGRLFRLNPDGTMPRDQAGTTPAVAGGIAEPRGLAWDARSGLLWIADDDNGSAHVSGVALSAPPVRAVVSGRGTLKAAVGQIAIYASDVIAPLRNEALLASPDGFIIRLHFAAEDPTRIAHAGRLLDNVVGPIHVVTPAPDGAIYFCTPDSLGRLTLVR
jgi:glucose/arabinose dehydrogenase